MQPSDVQHTLTIFERLYRDLPPLVPTSLVNDMAAALEQMRHNHHLSLETLETTLLSFGKKVWPYRRAFMEFYDMYESELAESFLRQRLSGTMKQRYEEFVAHGGQFRDLHDGHPLTFFSLSQRQTLCTLLVDVTREVRQHTTQIVLSTERRRYEQRVVEFQIILDDIEKRLDSLRQMADDEQEHPDLAAEIRQQVRAFEQGLCLLGPRTRYDAVCSSEEHFVGRRQDKALRPAW